MLLLLVIVPVILLVLGIPIFLILLATSELALLFLKLPSTVIHQVMYDALNKWPLLAVPFFIFAGDLMARGGISVRLLRWVTSMIGTIRGSLPMTSLGLAAVFGAISGATSAGVAAVGQLTYPQMRKAGYSEKFASGLVTAENALDNLIPPSLGFILYGIAAETSVVHLFAAAIDGRSASSPMCDAMPRPRGWAMPCPSKIRRSGRSARVIASARRRDAAGPSRKARKPVTYGNWIGATQPSR
jgi:C4-dicarboxylate transporter DctM subunit